jgi:hypothetical protein
MGEFARGGKKKMPKRNTGAYKRGFVADRGAATPATKKGGGFRRRLHAD